MRAARSGRLAGYSRRMLLLLLACPAAPEKESPPGPDPIAALSEVGPHAVGMRVSTLTWEAPDGPRDLRLVTWYPAKTEGGSEPSYHRQDLSVSVTTDAPIAAGSFPLALYSHGHMGYAEASSFLAEHLASHGWIVVAPDHRGNTLSDGSNRSTEIYYQRPMDLSAILDALPTDSLVGPQLADGPALALGHSFGGYTLLALAGATYDPANMAACTPDSSSFCSSFTPDRQALFEGGFFEDRIGAFVAMAPGDSVLFGEAGLQAIAAPVLHMTATLDQPEGSEGDRIWEGLRDGDDRRMVLVDGGHQSFSDFADQLEQVPLAALDGFVPIKAYSLAWGLAMRGDSSMKDFLAGEPPLDHITWE